MAKLSGMKTGSWCTSTLVVGLIYLYILAVEEVMGQDVGQSAIYRPAAYSPDQQSFYPGASSQGAYPQDALALASSTEPQYGVDFKYHNYDDMTRFLRTTSSRFPNLTALYSIGKSVQGRDLWVMVVSASPYEHMIGKPDVKYVANMHGNEAVGREMMLHLIHYLVTSYETDQYIRWLLDNTRIHILPSMNPDGFEVAREGTCDGGQGRYNARGFDLNRNFPDYFKQNNKRSQPETEAVKEWVSKIQFVLSGGLHGGALVASYPFDNTPNTSPQVFQSYSASPSLTPDDDVFKHLALTYSTNHNKMHRGSPCKPGTPSFNQGITNGAAWYPLTGGMQDFNYVWYGCMEVTIEMSCCKYPAASELSQFWEDNRLSLVKFLAEAHRGVHGFVMDENGNAVEKASLKVKGRDVEFHSTKYGEFWRILLPGMYKMEVYADGYVPRELEFAVVEQHPTLLNVTLHPTSKVGHRGGSQQRRRNRPVETPPWLGGSGGGSGGGAGVVVTKLPDNSASAKPNIGGNRGDIGDNIQIHGDGATAANWSDSSNNNNDKQVTSSQRGTGDVEPYTFFNPGSFSVTYPPHRYNSAKSPSNLSVSAGLRHLLISAIILLAAIC